jgi:hypothetical protein
MLSSEMLRRMALVRTDVSEELSASFIRVTRISELGTTLAVTSNRLTLRRNAMEALNSSEMSVLTRPKWCNIPGDGVLHSTAMRASNLTQKKMSTLPYTNTHIKFNESSTDSFL